MVQLTTEQVRRAYLLACAADVDALKPGNVSRYSAGHRMTAEQFIRSSEVTVDQVVDPDRKLGDAIRSAAQATMTEVGCNTNLGIILLCTPIAHAAFACETKEGMRNAVARVIVSANTSDTQAVFDAIALMNPAGLGGSHQHDVRMPAAADLLSVMQFSAERDRIAWQYANNFDDVLSLGYKTYLCVMDEAESTDSETLKTAAQQVFFEFLCRYPDSHIARKHGAYMAEAVRDEARKKKDSFSSLTSDEARHGFLLSYDQELKFRSINPGTCADLTVATLFLGLLFENL